MYILGCKNRKTASGIQTYHQAWIPDAVFYFSPRNRRGLGARKPGNALIALAMHQVPRRIASEPTKTWCMKAGKGYSMLFKDSVMLMFSSRRDMAMLTMKAKTKVRITARA